MTLKIHYMRDNHTFAPLPTDVVAAIAVISMEFMHGYTHGMLCTSDPTLKVVRAHGDLDMFLDLVREWYDTDLHMALQDGAVPEDLEVIREDAKATIRTINGNDPGTRMESTIPTRYRLKQKLDGALVLEGAFPWAEGTTSWVDWRELPTEIEELDRTCIRGH